jgi:hypothetical protein
VGVRGGALFKGREPMWAEGDIRRPITYNNAKFLFSFKHFIEGGAEK